MAVQTFFHQYNTLKYNQRTYNFQTTSLTFLAFAETITPNDVITKNITLTDLVETITMSDVLSKTVTKLFFEFQGMVDETVEKEISKVISQTVRLAAWLTTRKNKGSSEFQGE